MGNQNQKSTGTVALIVLLLLVAIVALILATYAWAKYTSTVTAGASAAVAQWSVSASNTGAFTQTFTYVLDHKLAPGTSGNIPVTVSATGSEVAVDYSVYLTSVTNKPTNLIFYKSTDAGAKASETVADSGDNIAVTAGNNAVSADTLIASGRIAIGGANVTQNIYWEWPFTTPNGDSIDTADGEAAATMTVNYKVVFTQVQPQ